MLTKVSLLEEIKIAIFDLNGDGAPDPNGFSGFFFQLFWDIMVVDVILLVLDFFCYKHSIT